MRRQLVAGGEGERPAREKGRDCTYEPLETLGLSLAGACVMGGCWVGP